MLRVHRSAVAAVLAAMLLLVGMAVAAACPLAVAPRAWASAPKTVSVQFRTVLDATGDVRIEESAGELAKAKSSLTIEEAFAASGADVPRAQDEGRQFEGWAVKAGASSALRGYTVTLADVYAKAGDDGIVTLYAVFGPERSPRLKFYAPGSSKLLAQVQVESRGSIAAGAAALGKAGSSSGLLASGGKLWGPALRKPGYRFAGWKDAQGVLRYNDEPLVDDAKLRPSYKKLSASASGIKGAAVDVSGAYVTSAAAQGAKTAGAKLAKASKVPSKLKAAATKGARKLAGSYRATFGFTAGGKETLLETGFGTLVLQLPCSAPDGVQVKAYWLKADGSVAHSSAKKVGKGTVRLKLSSCRAASGANIVLSYKPAAKAKKSGSAAATRRGASGGAAGGGAGAGAAGGSNAAGASASSGAGDGTGGGDGAGAGAGSVAGDGAGVLGDGVAPAGTGEEADVYAQLAQDGGFLSADDAAAQRDARAGGAQTGSGSALAFGLSMLAIAALALAAWRFAFKRKNGGASETHPEA